MIAKAKKGARTKRARQPVDVRLTVAFRFGDDPGDHVTVMDDRRIPMVGTLFESRDAILRGFTKLLIKAGTRQPKVAAELLPILKLLRPNRRKSEKNKKK